MEANGHSILGYLYDVVNAPDEDSLIHCCKNPPFTKEGELYLCQNSFCLPVGVDLYRATISPPASRPLERPLARQNFSGQTDTLYFADSECTAVWEVLRGKPSEILDHGGSDHVLVEVSTFGCVRQSRLADFTFPLDSIGTKLRDIFSAPENEWQYDAEGKSRVYLVTAALTQMARNAGLDGIVHHSTQNREGCCIGLFAHQGIVEKKSARKKYVLYNR